MSPLTCEHAAALFSDLLADEATAEAATLLEAHLESCERCYKLAIEFVQQDLIITGMAAKDSLPGLKSRLRQSLADSSVEGNSRSASRRRLLEPRRPGSRALRWGLAAAFLVGSVVMWIRYSAAPPPGDATAHLTPRIERVEGKVLLVGAEGESAIETGSSLVPGQALRTRGALSRVVLVYPDSTRLEVGPDAELAIPSLVNQGVQQIVLSKGSLHAEVARQPKGRSMLLRTPHAEARIVGTTLNLFVRVGKIESTRLHVEEGKVTFQRLVDGVVVDVPGGYQAVAAVGTDLTPQRKFSGWDVDLRPGWALSPGERPAFYAFSGSLNTSRIHHGVAMTSDATWDLRDGPIEVSFQWEVNERKQDFEVQVYFVPNDAVNVEALSYPAVSFYHNGLIVNIKEKENGIPTGFLGPERFPAAVTVKLDTEKVQGNLNELRLERAYVPFTGPVRVRIALGSKGDPTERFVGSLQNVQIRQLGK